MKEQSFRTFLTFLTYLKKKSKILTSQPSFRPFFRPFFRLSSLLPSYSPSYSPTHSLFPSLNTCTRLALANLLLLSGQQAFGNDADYKSYTYTHTFTNTISNAETKDSKLNWMTNYETTLNLSNKDTKPVLMLFTGSDWCGWCIKLDNEVFKSQDFITKAKDSFHFLKIDFPVNKNLPSKQIQQNNQLIAIFDIKNFPTLVLLDEKQQVITKIGYQPGGGDKYADYLAKVMTQYNHYKATMNKLKNITSSIELKLLYEKAQELGQSDDIKNIVDAGLAIADNDFFLKETYRKMVEEGLIHNRKAKSIRKSLLKRDPKNERKHHFNVAVIEFQRLSEELESSDSISVEEATQPLVAYINDFGNQDKDNLWRLQMTISQVFLSKNKFSKALKYAKDSLKAAPNKRKSAILSAIKNIEEKKEEQR